MLTSTTIFPFLWLAVHSSCVGGCRLQAGAGSWREVRSLCWHKDRYSPGPQSDTYLTNTKQFKSEISNPLIYGAFTCIVFDILEQRFLQSWRRREGTQTARQKQPASQGALLPLTVPGVVHQLSQNLVSDVGLRLALFHNVVSQHLLLPASQIWVPSETQNLRKRTRKDSLAVWHITLCYR